MYSSLYIVVMLKEVKNPLDAYIFRNSVCFNSRMWDSSVAWLHQNDNPMVTLGKVKHFLDALFSTEYLLLQSHMDSTAAALLHTDTTDCLIE
jgi:hypothetical protein